MVLGEQVSSAKEFARIVTLDPIHVRVDFPQERVDDVFIGQLAEVVLDSFPQETFEAKVIRISPRVDSSTRVLAVVLEMPNPKNRIKAGISAFARLKVSKPYVTAVPATAIVHRGSKAVVFRIVDGRAKLREVEIGNSDVNSRLEVRSGLAPGDTVVVERRGPPRIYSAGTRLSFTLGTPARISTAIPNCNSSPETKRLGRKWWISDCLKTTQDDSEIC